MGIKGLRKVLSSNGYEANKIQPSKFFKNIQYRIVGIDTSIFLYSYCAVYGEKYIYGFVKQIIFLLKFNVLPVFIFDGKPTVEKSELIETRKEEYIKKNKKINMEELKLINNFDASEDDVKNFKVKKNMVVKITSEIINNVKSLFDLLGIFHYTYDGEADLFIRYLFENKLIDYVLSNDMDLLTHGCDKVILNFNTSNAKQLDVFDIKNILSKMEINMEQFIDICILLGCDYTNTVNGIGPVSAVKFIKEYKSIEGIIKNKPSFNYDDFDYKMARNMFLREINIPEKFSRDDFNIRYKKNNNIKQSLQKLGISTELVSELLTVITKYVKLKEKCLI